MAGLEMQLYGHDIVSSDAVEYRWEIALAPAESEAVPPARDQAIGIFTPDLRGNYQVDRFVVLGVAEDLTHRFQLQIGASNPIVIALPEQNPVNVGDTIRIDASQSYSPEHFPLTFRWDVLSSPRNVLGFPQYGSSVAFEATATGTYLLAVTVSDPTTSTRVNVMVFAQ